jgi:hypothetical protein
MLCLSIHDVIGGGENLISALFSLSFVINGIFRGDLNPLARLLLSINNCHASMEYWSIGAGNIVEARTWRSADAFDEGNRRIIGKFMARL